MRYDWTFFMVIFHGTQPTFFLWEISGDLMDFHGEVGIFHHQQFSGGFRKTTWKSLDKMNEFLA